MEDQIKQKTKISLKAILNNILPDFSKVDNQTIQLYCALFIGILTLLYVLLRFLKGGSKKNIVAILGLCESGKTVLFSRLCHQRDVLSVTSLKESSAHYLLKNNSKVVVYDLPGHDRIRYRIFDKIKQQVKALIFVVDAASIQKDIRDVAEFLYTVFCDGCMQSGRPKVLIVCNKQDLPMARGMDLIKISLEKEINLLRITKSNQLETVGEGGNNNSFLGLRDDDFEFSHLKPIKVSFVEAIAKEGKQLNEIEMWINAL